MKHYLGRRAYYIFLLRRVKIPVILFIISFIFLYIERWLSPYYAAWSWFISGVFLATALIYLALVAIAAYLEYISHSFSFTNDAFVYTKGIASRSEATAIYHQIQNVNINRSPMNRVWGVCEIAIYMAGAERDDGGHSKIVLPAIGMKRARAIQSELLKRARRHFSQVIPKRDDSEGGRDGHDERGEQDDGEY